MGIPVWTDEPPAPVKRVPAAASDMARPISKHMHHTDPAEDDELEGECLRELDERELEPLGRTYVARQYRLDRLDPRRSRRPAERSQSDLELNQTLVDYVQRLRQHRAAAGTDGSGDVPFSSIVEQIRAIGAAHDSSLNDSAGVFLSPLDLDGFYSSSMRIRRNTYSNSDTPPSPELANVLHRFEVLDDRIALIRLARRELRMMEYEASANLDAMRFAA